MRKNRFFESILREALEDGNARAEAAAKRGDVETVRKLIDNGESNLYYLISDAERIRRKQNNQPNAYADEEDAEYRKFYRFIDKYKNMYEDEPIQLEKLEALAKKEGVNLDYDTDMYEVIDETFNIVGNDEW